MSDPMGTQWGPVHSDLDLSTSSRNTGWHVIPSTEQCGRVSWSCCTRSLQTRRGCENTRPCSATHTRAPAGALSPSGLGNLLHGMHTRRGRWGWCGGCPAKDETEAVIPQLESSWTLRVESTITSGVAHRIQNPALHTGCLAQDLRGRAQGRLLSKAGGCRAGKQSPKEEEARAHRLYLACPTLVTKKQRQRQQQQLS